MAILAAVAVGSRAAEAHFRFMNVKTGRWLVTIRYVQEKTDVIHTTGGSKALCLTANIEDA